MSTPPPVQDAGPEKEARIPYPRSKKGCLTCRQRKKKCDEVRPRCAACRRLQVECVWSRHDPERLTGQQEASENSAISAFARLGECLGVHDMPDEVNDSTIWTDQDTGTEDLQPDVLYPDVPLPRGLSGLPRATALTPNSMTILRHYLQVTGPMLAAVPAHDSPFMQCFLPLAHADNVLMHAILALGGTHLAYYQQQHADESLGIMSATWRHYAIVVSSLRADFAQLDLSDTKQLLRLLQILIVLCHYEALTGNKTTNPFFKHLRAVRQLVLALLHHPQQSATNSTAFGQCLELYAYLVFANTLTPHGAIEERTLPFDGFLASSHTLSSYSTFGVMFVGVYDLFGTIPRISILAGKRLALEASPDASRMTDLLSTYHTLQSQITSWTSRPQESDGTLAPSEREERRIVYEIHRHAVLAYLETAIAGSLVSDPAAIDTIQGHVHDGMRLLSVLPAAQSASLLFWSLVVLGSCAVTPAHREQMGDRLKNSRYQMRHTYTAYCMLRKLWEDYDPRAFGPFGLLRAMQRHGWCFACV